jgi:hypothetical protein
MLRLKMEDATVSHCSAGAHGWPTFWDTRKASSCAARVAK